ncbi:hypothetical protein DIU31_029770 [Mucilaginibacter rubeus]|uniref:Uncharacterized protein n=1 Tax=Mucilaginibacter rubeus TaxID=2027860 RepID=A0AAE6JMS2_9SPHI|nr:MULTISPECIES: hypothetical protein [Mucilaginibacter]QEM07487.1 hypothetical protein DIU31_029770 [Mucilaginibacter rubeus]QEM19941.1 hypothetical protein DIU38_029365 [Mucilaginibacter gossypii]QTE43352.1 hypothetical protein J3L19_31285 [Mucilaginibacter rubeus]QTE49952.1 hypothetical protein J3L21_31240 [Mucilaginibacter rubeus]QTE55043.1 hypothetical protein J3L23_22860 [Mucilaginibacter rubeus]
MKKASPAFVLALTAQLLASHHSSAQSTKNSLQGPPANINIDGDLKEWGDSLRYYNEENKLNYALANDKDYLYAAIRISDRLDKMKVLNAGITLSIDPKGKKKDSFMLTFPLAAPDEKPEFAKPKDDNGEITQADRDELMRERITKLRYIKVVGFKDIDGDMITTSNTYGIKTAINYDANGDLVYEAAIPLSFFHAGNDAFKSEWAFNFKINGFQRPAGTGGGEQDGGSFGGGGGRGGRGGMGGGGMGGSRGGRGGRGGMGGAMGRGAAGGAGEISKSVDFWEKYYLSSK